MVNNRIYDASEFEEVLKREGGYFHVLEDGRFIHKYEDELNGYLLEQIQAELYQTIDDLISLTDDLSWQGLRARTYQSIGAEIRKGDKDLQLSTLVKIANYLRTDFNTLLGDQLEVDAHIRHNLERIKKGSI